MLIPSPMPPHQTKKQKQTTPPTTPRFNQLPDLTNAHDQRQNHATKGKDNATPQSKSRGTRCKKTETPKGDAPKISGGYPKSTIAQLNFLNFTIGGKWWGYKIFLVKTIHRKNSVRLFFRIFGKIFFMYKNLMGSMKKMTKSEPKMSNKDMAKPKLVGNQSKLDANRNGKIDSEDFKLLKKK